MKVTVLINGKEENFETDEVVIFKAITKIRNEIKTKFKKNKQQCELWFTNIII